MHNETKGTILCKVHPEVWWADALNSRIHPNFRMCSELLTVEGMNTEALQHQTIRHVWVFSWTWTENHGCMYVLVSHQFTSPAGRSRSKEIPRIEIVEHTSLYLQCADRQLDNWSNPSTVSSTKRYLNSSKGAKAASTLSSDGTWLRLRFFSNFEIVLSALSQPNGHVATILASHSVQWGGKLYNTCLFLFNSNSNKIFSKINPGLFVVFSIPCVFFFKSP